MLVCVCTCLDRCLAEREQRLLKRRQAAEEALLQQQELLERERHLEREEENLRKIVDQVRDTYEQRQTGKHRSPRRSRAGGGERRGGGRGHDEEEEEGRSPQSQTRTDKNAPIPPVSSALSKVPSTSTTTTTNASSSIPEALTEPGEGVASASQIRTELSPGAVSRVPSEYLQDTFASSVDSTLLSEGAGGKAGERGGRMVTSTPVLLEEGGEETPAFAMTAVEHDYSLTESLGLSGSQSGE